MRCKRATGGKYADVEIRLTHVNLRRLVALVTSMARSLPRLASKTFPFLNRPKSTNRIGNSLLRFFHHAIQGKSILLTRSLL